MFKSLLLGLIALLFGASVKETKSTVVNLKGLNSKESVVLDDCPKSSVSTNEKNKPVRKLIGKLRLRKK
jgi:hypothetical protein